MPEGAWVVLGTAIGAAIAAVGSILTAYLTAHFQKKPDKYEEAANKVLREVLEKGHKWQNLSSLANVIGATEDDTKAMLLMLGARASQRNPMKWGLMARNPITDRTRKVMDDEE